MKKRKIQKNGIIAIVFGLSFGLITMSSLIGFGIYSIKKNVPKPKEADWDRSLDILRNIPIIKNPNQIEAKDPNGNPLPKQDLEWFNPDVSRDKTLNHLFGIIKNQNYFNHLDNDMLFFLKRLMELNYKNNILMGIDKPIISKNNQKYHVILNVKYRNQNFYSQNIYLDTTGKDLFTISPDIGDENGMIKIKYEFNGELEPTINKSEDGEEWLGYKFINGKNEININDISRGADGFSFASYYLKTELTGYSTNKGYKSIQPDFDAKIKDSFDTKDVFNEISSKQTSIFQLIRKVSNDVQPILNDLSKNKKLGDFLRDNSSLISQLSKYIFSGNVYAQIVQLLLPEILQNKSLAVIINEERIPLYKLLENVSILKPFLDVVWSILNGSIEQLKDFFTNDLIGLIELTGAGGIFNEIPGLRDFIPKLGSDEGILSILLENKGIYILQELCSIVPNLGSFQSIIDILNILSLPDFNLLEKPILDSLVKLAQSDISNISTKIGGQLDESKIARNKQIIEKLKNKDPLTLEKYFNNSLIDGKINEYFKDISVSISDFYQGGNSGFNIKLSFKNKNQYFHGGVNEITSRVLFSNSDKDASGGYITNNQGGLISVLIKAFIPNLNDNISNVISSIFSNNLNINSSNLGKFLIDISQPLVNNVKGTIGDWISNIKCEDIKEDANFNHDNLTLNGKFGIKYIFGKTLNINLSNLINLLPDNLKLGNISIPIKTIKEFKMFPNSLVISKNDYISDYENFKDSKISFYADSNDSGGYNIKWKGLSTNVLDINMPGTMKEIFNEYNFASWGLVAPLYKAVLPNIFYSIKKKFYYYKSNKNIFTVNDYDPNIIYDVEFLKIKSVTQATIDGYKKDLIQIANSKALVNIKGTEVHLKGTFKDWDFWKTEYNLDDKNIINKIDDISNSLVYKNQTFSDYIYLFNLNHICNSFSVATFKVEEINLSSFGLIYHHNFGIYDENTSKIFIQNKWNWF
ncbi:MAG: hypothetical protein ACRCW6_00935 [Mycoplasmoidaceae bacterium]